MAKKHKRKGRGTKKETFREKILTFLGVIIFFLPLPAYLLFTGYLYPAPNSGFLCLGYLGCAVVSIGVAIAFIKLIYFRRSEDHGSKMFLLVGGILSIGAVLIAISVIVMYVPSVYNAFDEDYVLFYFLMWALLFTPGFIYLAFRMAVNWYLHGRGLSRTTIKKKTKGVRNYWWYEELNQSYHLGWCYWLNKIFTVLYLGAVALHLSFGWCKIASPVVAFGISLLSFMNIPMWVLVMATEHLARTNRINKSLGPLGVFGMLFSAANGIAALICFFRYVNF